MSTEENEMKKKAHKQTLSKGEGITKEGIKRTSSRHFAKREHKKTP